MELTEAIEKTRVDRVQLVRGPRPRQFGSLVLTGHHLIFAPEPDSSPGRAGERSEFWLLHRAVDRASVDVGPLPESPAVLQLKCKNFLHCSFVVRSQAECQAVARSIERLSNLSECFLTAPLLGNIDFEYPFYHPKTFEMVDDGWTAFDVTQIYAKLSLVCSDRWRISHVNENFEVCERFCPSTLKF